MDDVARFDEAFRWFAEAASTRRSHLAYDVAADEYKLSRTEHTFSRDVVDAPPAADSQGRMDSSPLIFIVGLPRSGSTLLERTLTGLPRVRLNGETENFSRAQRTQALEAA